MYIYLYAYFSEVPVMVASKWQSRYRISGVNDSDDARLCNNIDANGHKQRQFYDVNWESRANKRDNETRTWLISQKWLTISHFSDFNKPIQYIV